MSQPIHRLAVTNRPKVRLLFLAPYRIGRDNPQNVTVSLSPLSTSNIEPTRKTLSPPGWNFSNGRPLKANKPWLGSANYLTISAPTAAEQPKLRQCFRGLRRLAKVFWLSWRACNKSKQRPTDRSPIRSNVCSRVTTSTCRRRQPLARRCLLKGLRPTWLIWC